MKPVKDMPFEEVASGMKLLYKMSDLVRQSGHSCLIPLKDDEVVIVINKRYDLSTGERMITVVSQDTYLRYEIFHAQGDRFFYDEFLQIEWLNDILIKARGKGKVSS